LTRIEKFIRKITRNNSNDKVKFDIR